MAKRLFLERRTYRRNRLQDAARLMPVLATVLIFAPIFIRGTDPGAGQGMADWLVYYFAIWIGVIALTALVNRALMRVTSADVAGTDGDAAPLDEG